MNLWRPSSTTLRHAVRITVAVLAASELTTWLGLSQGYWAVITTLFVMQASVGGTMGAAADRVLGTMAGAAAGAVGAWLQSVFALPQSMVIVLVAAPMAMLAMERPSFKLAPVTAAMVLLLGASESDVLRTAIARMTEIALGCVIGVLTAHFVLPNRAWHAVLAGTASLLGVFGRLAQAHLARADASTVESLNGQARRLLAAIATAALEHSRERAVHLAAGTDSTALLRTLRRVRSDIAILARAMAAADASASTDTAIGEALKVHFDLLAAFVSEKGAMPGLADLDAIIAEQPDAGSLHFALITLRRDLGDLQDRLSEQAAVERSG
jgi:uncharacterized membrane protein YccC